MISKNKKILMHLFIIFLLFFGFQSNAEENQNTIEIKNPIFTTKSIDGSPYEIKAEKGLQRESYLDESRNMINLCLRLFLFLGIIINSVLILSSHGYELFQ